MITQEDFEKAREDESYRPSFINQIELGDSSKYIRKILYKAKEVYSVKGISAAMQSCPPLRAYFGLSGGKSIIKVFPRSFSTKVHLNLDDFLSTLIDHEILGHSRLFYEGAAPFLPEEIAVMHEHIVLLNKRNCSKEYKRQAIIELQKLLS